MRLGIVIHGHRPDAMAAAHHAVAQLASCGAQVLVEDEVLAAFASGSVTSLNAPDARADVILSLGGDGTLLRGAQYALSWDAALLGVNLGRVGFLAEGEADALPRLLDKLKLSRSIYVFAIKSSLCLIQLISLIAPLSMSCKNAWPIKFI